MLALPGLVHSVQVFSALWPARQYNGLAECSPVIRCALLRSPAEVFILIFGKSIRVRVLAMTITLELLPTLVFAIVILCWLFFTAVFFFRKKPEKAPDQKRDRSSIAGVVLQMISYGLVWSVRRNLFTPMLSGSKAVEMVLSVVAVVAAIGSVAMVMAAVKILGKEWSVTARLVEGHKLATTGPYHFVRHPIYTGMFGMLVATGLAISHWLALLVAIFVFLGGTVIRVRSEEKLLREAFGSDFDVYVRRVSAILPGLY